MKPSVYIETTVVSYLTARPSRDIVIAGHQQTTREWWNSAGERFELFASQLVLNEAAAGDAQAAAERLEALKGITLLAATDEAVILSQQFLDSGTLPKNAAEDAAHIAIAVTNGADYLVTWNFRHMANAVVRFQIEESCRAAGYRPTRICSPEELMEPDYD